MKYYIAGEPSGDMVQGLSKKFYNKPKAKIRCWGGDLMKNSGGELVTLQRPGIYGFP